MPQHQRQLPKEASTPLDGPTLLPLMIVSHVKVVEEDLFQCYHVREKIGFHQDLGSLLNDVVDLQPPHQGCHQQQLRVAVPLPSHSSKTSCCCQEALKGHNMQVIAEESYLIVEES